MLMKKSMIFRILGIVGGVLLIVGIFLPYINYYGISESLFDSANENYVPYVLLFFSCLSIVVFALNKKVELAYMSVGASLTVATMYTISAIETFEFLSIGYYLIVVAPILMLVSLLLLDMSNKKKEKHVNTKDDESEVKKSDDINTQSIASQSVLQPNDFAQSIMDQPVMKSANNNDNNQNDFTNVQAMPLNNLSDLDGSSKESLNISTKDNDNQEQSILSVMDQPLIGANSSGLNINNEPTQVVEPVQPVIEQPTQVVEPLQPVIEQPIQVVEPLQPVIEQPTQVVEPVQPVIEQPTQVVEPVQPVIEQPTQVVEPVQPIMEQPTQVVEPSPVMDQPTVVIQPGQPIQVQSDMPAMGQSNTQNNESIFTQKPL